MLELAKNCAGKNVQLIQNKKLAKRAKSKKTGQTVLFWLDKKTHRVKVFIEACQIIIKNDEKIINENGIQMAQSKNYLV